MAWRVLPVVSRCLPERFDYWPCGVPRVPARALHSWAQSYQQMPLCYFRGAVSLGLAWTWPLPAKRISASFGRLLGYNVDSPILYRAICVIFWLCGT